MSPVHLSEDDSDDLPLSSRLSHAKPAALKPNCNLFKLEHNHNLIKLEGVRPAANTMDGSSSSLLHQDGCNDGTAPPAGLTSNWQAGQTSSDNHTAAPLGDGGADGKPWLEQKDLQGWRAATFRQVTPPVHLSEDDSDDVPVTKLAARGAKKRVAIRERDSKRARMQVELFPEARCLECTSPARPPRSHLPISLIAADASCAILFGLRVSRTEFAGPCYQV